MSTTTPPIPTTRTRSAAHVAVKSPRKPVGPAAPAPRVPAVVPPAPAAVRRRGRWKAVAEYPAAAGLFVATLPVLLAALALTRATSRGPGLYRQQRVGRAGRVFTIYKVRTMVHDCESLTGPRWSVPGDPRITGLGRVFRKLHIDELPQLWNVLRGDMALIGPRPERPEIVARLAEAVPGYHARHTVRPGITGYAQIHLPPDTTVRSVRNKVAYDRLYIRRMGAAMDGYVYACTVLKIVGLTRVYRRAPRRPAE